jgi:hypothetical protein
MGKIHLILEMRSELCTSGLRIQASVKRLALQVHVKLKNGCLRSGVHVLCILYFFLGLIRDLRAAIAG